MATYVQFTPSTTSAFSFQPVINGVQYNAIVTWNMHGRYYLNLYDTSGNLLLCRPVSATGPRIAVSLTWANNGVSGMATATTTQPHNVPVGELANVRISGTGTAFDGSWQALATSPTTVTYALQNPDENQPLTGQMSFDLNLVATLNLGGFLLFRYETMQFEYE